MASHSERILLTGARGFTGRYLRQALESQGHEVIGLVADGPCCENELVGDLRDSVAIARAVREIVPTYVIHLAAIAFVADEDVEAFYRVNVIGSLSLLRALADSAKSVKRVVIASSANVYGNNRANTIDESSLLLPSSHYAVSKRAMEDVAWLFKSSLPIVIARPFNYTGPGQEARYLVPKIVDHFRRRVPVIELGNLEVVRDFLDVRSVVDSYLRLMRAQAATGETVNICSSHGIVLRDIIETLVKITGHEIEVRVDPALFRPYEIVRLVGSNQRLRNLIGEPLLIPFELTLRDMLGNSRVL